MEGRRGDGAAGPVGGVSLNSTGGAIQTAGSDEDFSSSLSMY